MRWGPLTTIAQPLPALALLAVLGRDRHGVRGAADGHPVEAEDPVALLVDRPDLPASAGEGHRLPARGHAESVARAPLATPRGAVGADPPGPGATAPERLDDVARAHRRDLDEAVRRGGAGAVGPVDDGLPRSPLAPGDRGRCAPVETADVEDRARRRPGGLRGRCEDGGQRERGGGRQGGAGEGVHDGETLRSGAGLPRSRCWVRRGASPGTRVGGSGPRRPARHASGRGGW